MATFVYKDKQLTWQPERGYQSPQTGEWFLSPVDAVERFVDESPHQREDWVDLARYIQDFWAAHQVEDIESFEEVRFGGC